MIYVEVDGDVVVNRVICDDEQFAADRGWIKPDTELVDIGWVGGGGSSFSPPPPVPLTAEERVSLARRECQRRIYAVADLHAQMNMSAVAGAGLMTTDQMDAWKAGLLWIEQMRANWEPLAAGTDDITDDANWPTCPVAAAALADGF